MSPVSLRANDGQVRRAPEWIVAADAVDERVLARAVPPVLDIGCGPGRHVEALARNGHAVLGIDIAGPALSVARRRGALTLERSIFARVPAAGRWQTALLLDGNIGIGGDPAALLRRVHSVVAPDGIVLVEAAEPGTPGTTARVRLEVTAAPGPWFTLASIGIDALVPIAAAAGFTCREHWRDGERWFAELHVR